MIERLMILAHDSNSQAMRWIAFFIVSICLAFALGLISYSTITIVDGIRHVLGGPGGGK